MLGYGDISLDQLLKYGMGLDLFEHVSSLEQIRNKLVTLVKSLKDSRLLLDVDKYGKAWPGVFLGYNDHVNKFVRMHDIVGDVARAIAAKDPHGFVVIEEPLELEEWQRKEEFRNCSRISLKCKDLHGLPERLVCPNLEFFLLNCDDDPLGIPDTFFEKSELLRVLGLSKMKLTPLPSSIGFLSNLRTLCVQGCTLQDLAVIGELKKLQVLSFASCEIVRLPKEMMQLTDLRVLDLWDCSYLEVIPQNVISSLSRLEHLCLGESFTKWGAEGLGSGESNNACLSELNNLSYLKTLCVEIRDFNLLSKDLVFEKLTRYVISVSPVAKYVDYNRSARKLKLCRVNKPCLVDCFSKLFKTVEDLGLSDSEDTKHVLYGLDTYDFLQLKGLDIENCPGIQYIVDSTKGVPSHSAFPILEKLDLSGLHNMDAVCYGPIPEGSFGNLRFLRVGGCKRLKSFILLPMEQGRDGWVLPEMGSLDSTRDFSSTGSSATQELSRSDVPTPFFNEQVTLPSLEFLLMFELDNVVAMWHNQLPLESCCKLKVLEISECNKLLNVFPSNILKGLQSLEYLSIRNCDSIEEIFDLQGVNCKEIQDIATIPLRELSLERLNSLKSIWNKDPQGLVSFQNLRSLHIFDCPCLKCLFPVTIAKGLVQLNVLEIRKCGVEEIVANENGDEVMSSLFPKLTSLTLEELDKLKGFSRGKCIARWPHLKELIMWKCDQVETLFQEIDSQGYIDSPIQQSFFLLEKVSFPNLKILKLSGLPKLREIWDYQLSLGSFCNLHILEVEKCASLLNVVPNYLIASLQNLEELNVEKCDQLEEVFDLEELDHADYEHVGMFSKLEKLKLIDLPKLRYICNKDLQQISCFQNLNLLHVKQCGSLTHLLSSGIALGLVRLKDLSVEHCSMIKEIIMVEDRVADEIIFPQTTQLSLLSLPNLTSFYMGTRTHEKVHMGHCDTLACVLFHEKVSFPNLEILKLSELSKLTEIWDRQLPRSSFCNLHILEVKKCPFLFNVVPNNLIASLQNLEKLNVENCDQLKEVFDLEGLDHADSENSRMLSKLEELKLIDLPQLRHLCNTDLRQISFFQNLRVLQLKQCDSLMYLFSVSMALGLVQLNNLWVERCSQIKEIIKAEDGVADKIIFPQTTQLSLVSLPKLTSFYLRTQAPGMLFNEEVAFPSLGNLDISNLDSVEKIWHNEFVADSFGKLKRLSVRSCQILRNVIPSNMLKRLPSLQILKIVDSNSLEEIFDLESIDSKESHDIPTLQLRELCLDNLEKLKCVWNKAPQGLLTYPNLKSVQVSHCPSLKIPYRGYVVRSLLQVKVDMNSCGVKEIVAHEDRAEVASMFFFPEVSSLTNSCLKQLECFYLGLHNLEWPMLKTLEVESHESLEKLASKLDKPVEQPIFLCDKVMFPNLEVLNLSLKLEEMQDLHVLFGALSNLKTLIVENCPFLLSLFSPQFIECLNNLKELTVKKCNLLEEVFDLKGLAHGDDEHVDMLSKLEEVSLIDLPQLRDICNNSPPQVLCFQNLKSLQVKQCNSMTYLFSPSMVMGLVQLQDLHIEHCPALKEIFTMEGRDADNCPPQVSYFQNLKSLQVKQCESLMYLFSPSMALGLVQLQDLHIEDCPAMTKIVTAEDRDLYNQPPLVSCFQNLKSVLVKQCDSLMYLFSSSFALALAQLQDLRIENCYTMKEIVTAEEGVRDEIIFPQITRISLLKLPKLATFYLSQTLEKIHMGDSNTAPGVLFNEEVAFPKLEILYVSGLDNVKKIWHNKLLADSFSKLKKMTVKICNELQNISTSNALNWLPSLEILEIDSCGKLREVFNQEVINVQEDVTDTQLSQLVLDDLQQRLHMCNKVLGKYLCLQNLKILEVHNCGSVKNIFSPDMALGLVRLEGINEIIGQEDGAEEVIDKIEFPELTSLSLKSLPTLASFYPGSHTLRRVGPGDHGILTTVLFDEKVAFPSLKSLNISGLGRMQKIWHNKLIENSFSKLAEMKVECCDELQNCLPLFVLKSSSLQILRIANCGKLKEVFDLEGTAILDDVTETQLNELVLHYLPQLQYIWNRDPYGILTYENLELVEVHHCQVLKVQFPSPLPQDLSQLKKQLIRSHWTKDLREKDEGKDFVFPEVTYNELELPDLRKIKGKEVVVVGGSDYVGEISGDMPGSSG